MSDTIGLADWHAYTHSDKRYQTIIKQSAMRLVLISVHPDNIFLHRYIDPHGMAAKEGHTTHTTIDEAKTAGNEWLDMEDMSNGN